MGMFPPIMTLCDFDIEAIGELLLLVDFFFNITLLFAMGYISEG